MLLLLPVYNIVGGKVFPIILMRSLGIVPRRPCQRIFVLSVPDVPRTFVLDCLVIIDDHVISEIHGEYSAVSCLMPHSRSRTNSPYPSFSTPYQKANAVLLGILLYFFLQHQRILNPYEKTLT